MLRHFYPPIVWIAANLIFVVEGFHHSDWQFPLVTNGFAIGLATADVVDRWFEWRLER